MSSCIQGELSFGPPANDDNDRTSNAPNGEPLLDDEELASNDDREQLEPLSLATLLAKLASQDSSLTLPQTRRLHAEMAPTFGPPHSVHGHARQWRFDTEDAHGQLGTLSVNVPHDPERLASVTFTPPSSGTWIDESLDFSQEPLVEQPAPPTTDDPTGGKAIARALLARIQRSST